MDPLSLTVSIITIVTVAGQLVSAGNTYISSVSNCRQEVKNWCSELTALSQILTALKDVIDPSKATPKTPIILGSTLVGPIEECTKNLKEMLGFLDKHQKPSRHKITNAIRRLKWPFAEADIMTWIKKIEQHKKTFQLALLVDGSAITRSISFDVEKLKLDQKEDLKQQRSMEINKRLRDIRGWLAQTDPRVNYKAASMLQQVGSGKWFIEGNQFKEWFQKDNTFLWIHGILGTGKTVLSSIIIDKIIAEAKNEDITLVHFCCDSQESEKQLAVNLYGSLIAQLLEHVSDIPDEVNVLYNSCDTNKPAPLDLLKEVFSELTQNLVKLVIIIDGLDKFTDRAEVAEGLVELKHHSNGNTNILVTSRNDPAIRSAFSGLPSLEMKDDNVGIDIESYVKSEIEQNIKLKRLKPQVKAEIMTKLVGEANGMFRWAKCCLKHIAMLRNDKAIRQALQSFPSDLDETYANILTRIPEGDNDIAMRVFQWLVCSVRPMTIEQVVEGISIEVGDTTVDQGKRLNDPEEILEVCGGLVDLNEDTRILGFAHHSVKEYLTSERIFRDPASSYWISPRATNIQLAKICLTYILSEDFEFGPCLTNDELKDRFEKYPLLEYAAHNWQTHAGSDDKNEDNQLLEMSAELLTPLSAPGNFLSWAQAYHTEGLEIHCDHEAFQRCSSFASVDVTKLYQPFFNNFPRQLNCGCQVGGKLSQVV